MTSERLVSLDILRGATMAFLCLEVLRLPLGTQHYPDSVFWHVVSTQASHATWTGMTLWDLIQPAFMFMVGVALPWSVANRRARGQTSDGLWRHALWRSVALILLGLMLVSLEETRTLFDFTNVLTQIGLGYMVVFALACLRLTQTLQHAHAHISRGTHHHHTCGFECGELFIRRAFTP